MTNNLTEMKNTIINGNETPKDELIDNLLKYKF